MCEAPSLQGQRPRGPSLTVSTVWTAPLLAVLLEVVTESQETHWQTSRSTEPSLLT